MPSKVETIPARHGTATFVPRGHTIKIINVSGTQVFATWVFALRSPPKDPSSSEEIASERGEGNAREVKPTEREKNATADTPELTDPQKVEKKQSESRIAAPDPAKLTGDGQNTSNAPESTDQREDQERSEIPIGKPGSEKLETANSNAVPSRDSRNHSGAVNITPDAVLKKGWSSYLPSLAPRKGTKRGENQEEKGEDNQPSEEPSRTWTSYIPSGKGFTSYLPSQGTLSAFAASHHRDPSKPYAEQLYDFSKTPVGAASLSAATGSGTAGSLYAAFNAYQKMETGAPPIEYMSLPHTHLVSGHLRPRVDDVFLSNIGTPLLVLLEDSSPGTHDSVVAACDPQTYKRLGLEKWEEHGSCAENLILALKELNQKARLKGANRVGAGITVDMVPQPLHLFQNTKFNQDGSLEIEAPKAKKGAFVRFKAEQDVVVVMSACPQDKIPLNGTEPTGGQFVVEALKHIPRKFLNAESSLAGLRRRWAEKVAKEQRSQEEVGKPAAEHGGKSEEVDRNEDVEEAENRGQEHTEILTADEKHTPHAAEKETRDDRKLIRNKPPPGKKKPRKLERRS